MSQNYVPTARSLRPFAGNERDQSDRKLSVEKGAADFWHKATEEAWRDRDKLAAKLQRAREGMKAMREEVQAWARDHESWGVARMREQGRGPSRKRP